jgi:hypothetical protein
MNKSTITLEKIKSIFIKKGYTLNSILEIVGVRTLDECTNSFNDFICLIYKGNLVGVYEATTDPALFYLNNPMNVNGTAILPEGQHKNLWALGLHKGYPALTQARRISVYRDKNKDSLITIDNRLHNDASGINLHRGHETWLRKQANYLLNVFKIKIGKYSAGCQVVAFADDLKAILEFCKLSKLKTFDYTLLNEKDFI